MFYLPDRTRYMNTREESKSSILFEALDLVLGENVNRARLKLIALFIIALNQVRQSALKIWQ